MKHPLTEEGSERTTFAAWLMAIGGLSLLLSNVGSDYQVALCVSGFLVYAVGYALPPRR
jgi:hypothetical protein